MFPHLKKASNTFHPDILELARKHKVTRKVTPLQYTLESDREIFNPLQVVDELLKIGRSKKHFDDATVVEDGKIVVKPMEWETLTSPLLTGVKMISYKVGNNDRHRVVLINRGDKVDYYNSSGEQLHHLPPELIAGIGVGAKLANVTSSKYKHQGAADTCGYHSLSRACFSHLNDDEYNGMIEKVSHELGISKDQVVYSAGKNTAEKEGEILKEEKPRSLKKGGLLKKGERSVPVPIIAHSGELVVPVDTVDDVLNSNAWKKHVKRISAKKGVSISEAYKMSLGL